MKENKNKKQTKIMRNNYFMTKDRGIYGPIYSYY